MAKNAKSGKSNDSMMLGLLGVIAVIAIIGIVLMVQNSMAGMVVYPAGGQWTRFSTMSSLPEETGMGPQILACEEKWDVTGRQATVEELMQMGTVDPTCRGLLQKHYMIEANNEYLGDYENRQMTAFSYS